MKVKRIAALVYKEWREVLRDRLFFYLAFIVPVLLMLLLGFGLSLDVENIPFAVIDYDRTPQSRRYIERYRASPYFNFKGYLSSHEQVDPVMMENRIRMAVLVPEGFREKLARERASPVQVIIDGTFPFRAQTMRDYIVALHHEINLGLLAGHLAQTEGIPRERALERVRPVRLQVRYLFNENIESVWSLAPKLIMVVLLFMPPFLTSMGVVREKENGSIHNIYASTVTRGEFLLGKWMPYAAVAFLNALVLWGCATLVFGAPFKGNFALFAGASLLYVICTTGMGLLVSVLVGTQVAAVIITFIITVLPAMLYSGLLIPVDSLSRGARLTAHLLPAMYYTRVLSGCFLKAVGLQVLWREMAVLGVYAVVLYCLGFAFFRKRPRS